MSDLNGAVEGLRPVVAGEVANASAGRLLREAREAKKFSLEDVAQYLKFRPKQIGALENDDYGALPGPVAVRGMIRSYAKLLGLDAEALLAMVADRLNAAPPPMTADAMNVTFPVGPSRGHRSYWVMSALAAAGAVAFVVDWSAVTGGVRGLADRMGVTSPPSAASAPVPTPPRVEERAPGVPRPDDSFATVSTMDALPAAVTASASEVAPRGAQPLAAVPAGHKRVLLQFSQDSWVEIRQADGRVLFSQMNPAGTERAIDVVPPVRLVVGAARSVTLFYNGTPVDLASHTKVDVARLGLE